MSESHPVYFQSNETASVKVSKQSCMIVAVIPMHPSQRKYLRTRYNVERELSVEFDNLMDDDYQEGDTSQYGTLLTEQERKMITERRFTDLTQYQRRLDAEIDAQLEEQEEQLRRDEEAFYEAKREAARVAAKLCTDETKHGTAAAADGNWAPADEWEIANGDEDFEQFLQSVRERSLTARTKIAASQAVSIETSAAISDPPNSSSS